MEALWHFAADQDIPDGDLSSLSAQDIADEIFYDGDADELLVFLKDAGWVDHEGDSLTVHDWADHCPEYVHTKLAKKTARFANGILPTISTTAFNADTRARIKSEYVKTFPDKSGQVPESLDKSRQVLAIPSVVIPSVVTESPPTQEDKSSFVPPKGKKEPFKKPTQTECAGYAKEIGLPMSEARAFYDYQESKGWKVGIVPMKDWRAAMRTWKHNFDKNQPTNGKPHSNGKPKMTPEEIARIEASASR